jgi:DNA-directed RNA polymerase subunit E'/Rpb7
MEGPLKTIFTRGLITKKIILPVTNIGKNIKQTIETYLKANYEGKCQIDGFIRPGSCNILSYSCGTIFEGNKVSFDVIFDCYLCFPVEGMLIECITTSVTKAGVRCESNEFVPSPIIAFLAKEHHQGDKMFNAIKEGDKIIVKVIGQRFELNDPNVSIIGELSRNQIQKNHPKTNANSRKNNKK